MHLGSLRLPSPLFFISRSVYEWLGGLSLLLVYVGIKRPFLMFDGPVNPDESQMLAQAIALQHDPVFWRSVDGTTAGPLNSYLIWGMGQLGLAYTYLLLHALATVLVAAMLWTGYKTLRLFTSRGAALTSLLITYLSLLLSDHKDFNHYNSELLSVTLLTISLYVLVRSLTMIHSPWYRYFILGALCCLVPLAKLQGGPLAGLYLLYTSLTLYRSNKPARRKWISFAALFAGSATVLTFLLALLWTHSLLNDAYVMYIQTNLTHYQSGNGWHLLVRLLFTSSYDYVFLLAVNVGLWLLALYAARQPTYSRLRHKHFLWFLVANLLLSLWVAGRTGYIFEHYLFYTFLPITCLTGYALQLIQSGTGPSYLGRLSYGHLLAMIVLGHGVNQYAKTRHPNQHFNPTTRSNGEQTVISLVNRYAKPGDCLAIWGWNCHYYVATGLWQATRENHSIRCMKTNSLGALHNIALIDWYRRQYVQDIQRNRPVVFVDEVRANTLFTFPETVVHETIPDLHAFVQAHYQLVSQQGGIRVYLRSDRFDSQSTQQAFLPVLPNTAIP